MPTYCAVRTKSFIYVAYRGGQEELYRLSMDAYELRNLASEPRHAGTLSHSCETLRKLCDPPPPGYDLTD